MTFAFGHLLGAWLLGKLYEKTSRKVLSSTAWLFLLVGGLLPDTDFLLDWTLRTTLHRTSTHSLLFVLLASSVIYSVFLLSHHQEQKTLALALGAGILTHLFLDFFSPLGVPLFWPHPLYFSYQSVHSANPASYALFTTSLAQLTHNLRAAVLDMALGTIWMLYLAYKKRLRF